MADQDNQGSKSPNSGATTHRHSKVITAFTSLDRALHWRYDTKNLLPEEEESIEIRFFVLLRDCPVPMEAAAMKSLLKQLEGTDVSWFVPARREWVFNLDQLKQQFKSLTGIEWCTGSARLEPEFQVENQREALGRTKYFETFIVFYLNPRIMATQKTDIDGNADQLTFANRLYQDVKELMEAKRPLNRAEAELIIEKVNDAIKEFGSTNQSKKIELRDWKTRAELSLPPKTFQNLKERTEGEILTQAWRRPWIKKRIPVIATIVVITLVIISVAVYFKSILPSSENVNQITPQGPTPISPPAPSAAVTDSPSPTPKQGVQQPGTAAAKEFVVEVLSVSYRRAFKMGFETRFARTEDFPSVRLSINECYADIKKQYVRAIASYPDLKAALFSLLRHIEAMNSMLSAMERARRAKSTNDSQYLIDRLDGTGPPRLTESFKNLESHRTAFIGEMKQLADRFSIQLEDVPMTEVTVSVFSDKELRRLAQPMRSLKD